MGFSTSCVFDLFAFDCDGPSINWGKTEYVHLIMITFAALPKVIKSFMLALKVCIQKLVMIKLND